MLLAGGSAAAQGPVSGPAAAWRAGVRQEYDGARFLRELIDPVSAPVRCEPSTIRDLMISASNCRIMAFDNLSAVPTWLSDALCRLSTGGGFCTRQLHSNDEETIFDAQRPVILTGIEEIVTRGDLLDRTLVVHLPAICGERRRSEQELLERFKTDHPRLLGALLDVIVAAIRELPAARRGSRLPRLADFAVWVRAAETCLPWELGSFERAYVDNAQSKVDLVLEGWPVAQSAISFARQHGSWKGTPTALLATLARHASTSAFKHGSWPTNPQSLSRLLVDRLAPHLLHYGVKVSRSRRSGERRAISLELISDTRSPQSYAAG